MAEVTIELIKALRERTGAGIMDCKRALADNDCDIEKAVDFLRQKGIAKAATRANRIAAEGLTDVAICTECGRAAVVEVNCETDFVAQSDKFHDIVKEVTGLVLKNKPTTIEEAREITAKPFADAAVAMGEKFEFRRFVIVDKAEGQFPYSYIHMGGKISVLVILDKEDAELGKSLAMHIAANNPVYVALEDVPAADRERELNIAKGEIAEDPKLANKPAEMLANIASKKVDKVLSQSCLTLQNYLMDDSKTVGQVLKEKGINVVKFIRFQVAEGIAA